MLVQQWLIPLNAEISMHFSLAAGPQGKAYLLKYVVSNVSDDLCVANGVDTSRTFFVLFVRFVVCYIPRRCRKIDLRSRFQGRRTR